MALIDGTAIGETLNGNPEDDTINADAGNDTIVGGDGNDSISGGDGADDLVGGPGNDTLDGGAGPDRVSYFTGGMDALVDLAAGAGSATGLGTDTLISIENATGTDGNDTLIGNDDDNWLWGTGGTDSFSGGAGNDLMSVGLGDHTVAGGADVDTLSFFSETLTAPVKATLANQTGSQVTDQGTMTLTGIENLSGTIYGNDTLTGDAGDNVLAGWGGSDNLSGGEGADRLLGDGAIYGDVEGGISTVDDDGEQAGAEFTVTYNDTLSGGGGADTLIGGDGNDVLGGGAGQDSIDGGAGVDTVVYSASAAAVEVDLASGEVGLWNGEAFVAEDTVAGIENVVGSNREDVLRGDGAANVLQGGLGHDVLRGGDGDDVLTGGDDHDYLVGGAGNDVLDGGGDIDRVGYYVDATNGVNVNLADGTATGQGEDTLSGIEHATGTTFSDTLVGSDADNWLYGSTGNDSLSGGNGDDLIEIGDGNHTVSGGGDIDTLSFLGNEGETSNGIEFSLLEQGGAQTSGAVTVTADGFENVSGSIHGDTLTGDANANGLAGYAGDDSLLGGDGDDRLLGDGVASFDSYLRTTGPIEIFDNESDGNDTISGGNGADDILGGDGNDNLAGDAGNDTISGGLGNDTLLAGAGDDLLEGDEGDDTLQTFGQAGPAPQSGLDTLRGGDGNDLLTVGNLTVNGATSAADFTGTTLDGGAGLDYMGVQGSVVFLGSLEDMDGISFLPGYSTVTLPSGVTVASGPPVLTMMSDAFDFNFNGDGVTVRGNGQININMAAEAFDLSGLVLEGGANVGIFIEGGDGNDTITGSDYRDVIETNLGDDSIVAGGGNDSVLVEQGLGETATVTLGDGKDAVILTDEHDGTVVVTDFVAGDGGDDIVLADFLAAKATNYTAEANPFASGHIRLVQVLSDVAVQFDADGGGDSWLTVATLQNTTVADFTAANFDGFAPTATSSGTPSSGADSLTGTAGGDTIDGLAGHDSIAGLMGDDSLSGSDGNDNLAGGGGADTLSGGIGNDILAGGAENDVIDGGDGVDMVQFAGPNGVVVDLSLTTQATSADHGSDTITNVENVSGSGGADTLIGNTDANLLMGQAGHDSLSGGDGVDLLWGGLGDDTLDGGANAGGGDVAHYGDAAGGVAVDLSIAGTQNTFAGGEDTLVDIEGVVGSNHNDTLTGSAGDNTLIGGAGHDEIVAGTGNDVVNLGDGDDGIFVEQASGETLTATLGTGIDTVEIAATFAGAVVVTDFQTGPGGDVLDLEDLLDTTNWPAALNPFATGHLRLLDSGSDTLLQFDADGGGDGWTTIVTLQNTTAAAFTADNFDEGFDPNFVSPTATAGNDSLVGGAGNDLLDGLGGADTIEGAGGTDSLAGSAGADNLTGGGGADTLTGGADNDTLNGGTENDVIVGGDGVDMVVFGGNEAISVNLSTTTAQTINTTHGADTITEVENASGSFGNDTVIGNSDANLLLGGPTGHDSLSGAGGDDLLVGGLGNDTLDGGAHSTGDFALYNEAAAGVVVNLSVSGPQNTGWGGQDTLINIEGVVGGNFNDFLTGDDGDNTLIGGGGDDEILTGGGADSVDAGAGLDFVRVEGGAATVTLGAGADTLKLSPALAAPVTVTDFAPGDAGDELDIEDFLEANATGWTEGQNPFGTGHLQLIQNGLHTELQFDADGGADSWTTIVTFENTTVAAFTAANLDGFDPSGASGQSGTAGNDAIDGGLGADTISGLGGHDTLNGLGANDSLLGGAGDDNLNGGDDNDTVAGEAGMDLVRGGAGADSVSGGGDDDFLDGGAGDDTIDGGAGGDRVSYYNASTGVAVDLANGTATGFGTDTLVSVEHISGSMHNDTLTGSNGDNFFLPNGGDDVVSAGNGNDLIAVSEAGSNGVFDGGAGSDTMGFGGTTLPAGVGANVSLAAGSQDIGFPTDTTVTLTSIENLSGTLSNDTLTGDTGANTLAGTGGADSLAGGDGADVLLGDGEFLPTNENIGGGGIHLVEEITEGTIETDLGTIVVAHGADTLAGGNGADVLKGGGGDDELTGGAGNDTIQGGAGNDVAVFSGNRAAYTIGIAANGTITVTHNSGGSDGVDTVTAVELLRFQDGTVAADGGENLSGTAGADTWQGGAGADTYQGLAGGDSLRGGAGGDQIVAGDDNDLVWGEDGADSVNGGAGFDQINGGAGNDTIDGGVGLDRVSYTGAPGGVTVSLATGGAQNTGWGTDTLIGIEHLSGTNGNDNLTGDGGANWLWGLDSGAETISGGGGDDLIQVGAGGHLLDGGAGTSDTLGFFALSLANPIRVSLALQGATAQVTNNGSMRLTNFENLSGTTWGGDTLTGDTVGNILAGWGGSDSLVGGDGADRLLGDGAVDLDADGVITVFDELEVLPGATFTVTYNDTLNGGNGADTLLGGGGNDVLNGGAGGDSIDGGAGTDVAAYTDATAAVTVSLAVGTASGGTGSDTLTGIENVTGSNFGDTITGSIIANSLLGGGGNDTVAGGDGDDAVSGEAGADTLRGEVGNDTLTGGNDNDVLAGGGGNDSLNGGAGSDTASYVDATGAVTVNLATAGAQDTGQGSDTLVSVENVIGSNHNDTLTGDGFANILEGGAGDDSLVGGAGNDLASYAGATAGVDVDLALTTHTLGGGTGTDTWVSIEGVVGSAHDDIFTAGTAAATIQSGAGSDEIRLLTATPAGAVTTTDFQGGATGDVLNLVQWLTTNTDWDPVADPNPFEAGYLRLVQDGNATLVQTDVDSGDDTFVTLVRMENTSSLTLVSANFTGGYTPAAEINGGAGGDSFEWTPDTPAEVTVNGGDGTDELVIETPPPLPPAQNAEIKVSLDGKNLLIDLDGDGTDDLTITNVEELIISVIRLILSGDFSLTGLAPNTITYVGDVGGVVEDNLVDGTAMTSDESIDASGLGGADTLIGAGGNDLLSGGDGADQLTGNGANDTLNGGLGNDTLDGGAGSADVAVFSGNRADYTISGGTITHNGGGSDGVDTLSNIERLQFADRTTDGQGNSLGGGGSGGSGGGTPVGGAGSDQAYLGATADSFQAGAGEDTVHAGAGDDFVHGNTGADVLNGGDGGDTMHGGQDNDVLNGDAGGDLLFGDKGDDQVFGGTGDDYIEGGDGTNFLRGGDDNDVIVGGSGFDDAHGNIGNDTVSGGLGDDWVVGGQNQDVLFGDEGGDVVLGNLGEDSINGGVGNDVVRGGQGNDLVDGGEGSDWLAGDRGDDTITGGAGGDIFHSWGDAGVDRVLDFNYAEGDRVNLLGGTTYTFAQSGEDVVVSMTGGGELTLVGVQISSLADGWITVG